MVKKRRYKKRSHFSYWTVGRVLEVLEKNGLYLKRSTFTKLEDQGYFVGRRTPSGWRVYSEADIPIIIKILKSIYYID